MIRKKIQNISHLKEVDKKRQFRHCIILFLIIITACGNSSSQQKTDALQETEDKKPDSDLEAYVVPPGIKFAESRVVDSTNPPIMIDIANRKLNIKKFDISDYYTKIRYVKLKHPKPPTEGNYLLDATLKIRPESGGMTTYSGFNSLFKITDDYIISGDVYYGIHCYNKIGIFLYTIEANDFPKTYNVSENIVSVKMIDIKGFSGELFLNKNLCMYKILDDNKKSMICIYDLSLKERISVMPFELSLTFIDANSISTIADYLYHPSDTTRRFLYTFDIKGDTLCRFLSYNPISEKKAGNLYSYPSADIYYYKDQLTIRQSLNDTVFRVVSPNRILPAYVLNFGTYKVDVHTIQTEEQPEKMRTYSWKETDQFILFTYTQGRNAPINRRNGFVKFFYSYFDKKDRQLYHLNEGTTALENEILIENSIPDALPFLLSQVIIDNNQLYVCYSKKRLEEIIKSKGFSTLTSEKQNKLKTVQKELNENEVLIMFLE